MLLVRSLRFIRGSVTFEVKGKFAERFFNLLGRNGIPVFSVSPTKDGFYATTTVKKYFKIRPFVKKTHVRVHVVKRQGLPFLMKRYSKRIGLLAGVLVFALVLLLSGEFVWEIRVNGNELVSEQEILQSLEEMGLKRGVWKNSLDVQKLALSLRREYHEIGWAAVNLIGSVAEIEIGERDEGDEVVEDSSPCNVVASRGGQIVSMEVYDGQKAVSKGDTVKQGDLVVSGVVVSSKGKTILRHASAKIMAEYPEQYQVTIALSEEQKLIAGGAKNYHYLNIGSLRLPLFLAGKKPDECFERVYTRPIKVFGIMLPFEMTVHQVIPAKTEMVTISKEKAREFAEQKFSEYERQKGDCQVISRKISEKAEGDSIIFTADYVFCEDIAKTEPILLNSRTESYDKP